MTWSNSCPSAPKPPLEATTMLRKLFSSQPTGSDVQVPNTALADDTVGTDDGSTDIATSTTIDIFRKSAREFHLSLPTAHYYHAHFTRAFWTADRHALLQQLRVTHSYDVERARLVIRGRQAERAVRELVGTLAQVVREIDVMMARRAEDAGTEVRTAMLTEKVMRMSVAEKRKTLGDMGLQQPVVVQRGRSTARRRVSGSAVMPAVSASAVSADAPSISALADFARTSSVSSKTSRRSAGSTKSSAGSTRSTASSNASSQKTRASGLSRVVSLVPSTPAESKTPTPAESIHTESPVVSEREPSPSPSPVVEHAPSTVVEGAPSPTIQRASSPSPVIADREPSPMAEHVTTAFVESEPSPVVEHAPSHQVEAEPSPLAEHVTLPVAFVESEPSPIAEHVTLPVAFVGSEPSPIAEHVTLPVAFVESEPSPLAEHVTLPVAFVESEPSPVAEHVTLPVAFVESEPSPVVEHAPSHQVESEPSPLVEHVPLLNMDVECEPSPAVEEAPSPLVEHVPLLKMDVDCEPSPAVERAPSPLVEHVPLLNMDLDCEPSPAVEEVLSPLAERAPSPSPVIANREPSPVVSKRKRSSGEISERASSPVRSERELSPVIMEGAASSHRVSASPKIMELPLSPALLEPVLSPPPITSKFLPELPLEDVSDSSSDIKDDIIVDEVAGNADVALENATITDLADTTAAESIALAANTTPPPEPLIIADIDKPLPPIIIAEAHMPDFPIATGVRSPFPRSPIGTLSPIVEEQEEDEEEGTVLVEVVDKVAIANVLDDVLEECDETTVESVDADEARHDIIMTEETETDRDVDTAVDAHGELTISEDTPTPHIRVLPPTAIFDAQLHGQLVYVLPGGGIVALGFPAIPPVVPIDSETDATAAISPVSSPALPSALPTSSSTNLPPQGDVSATMDDLMRDLDEALKVNHTGHAVPVSPLFQLMAGMRATE